MIFPNRLQNLLLFLLAWTLFALADAADDPAISRTRCQGRRSTCSASKDCCSGNCLNGICRRACAKLNQPCTSDSDCCGRKVCGDSLVCIKPTTIDDSGGDGGAVSDVTSWPEAVGKTGEEAKTLIIASNSKLRVEIIPIDDYVTADYWEDRVRVRVDDSNIVVKTPTIG